MDYDDLEQFALKILLRWDEEKQVYVRTEAAGELAEYFEEVMIGVSAAVSGSYDR